MIYATIDQNFNESQVDYKITCILCDGMHGNNSFCQMPGGELYVA